MQIGELSRQSKASVRSIRHYEAKGLLQSQRLANGYREYQKDTVQRVRVIKTCLGLGFSLKETEAILGCVASGEEPIPLCNAALAIYIQRLQAVDEQIQTLMLIRESLLAAISRS